MTLDRQSIELKTDEELIALLKEMDAETSQYGGFYSNYHNKWQIKRELRKRRKLAKVSKATEKYCNDCPTKLLCTMSNANGSIYARDKLDMTLDGADMSFARTDYYRKEDKEEGEKPKFFIPIVKAGFQFSVLPTNDNINNDYSGSFYQERVKIAYRLMPLDYNEKTKAFSFVKYNDLPKTQLEYDRDYDNYALVYDNIATTLYTGTSSWYASYDDRDYTIDTKKLDKFQCPIFLEETFIKALRAIRSQSNTKETVRKEYGEETKTHFNDTTYNILTLHKMKVNSLYIPIKITPLNKTKAQVKKLCMLYKRESIIELPPMDEFHRELW